VTQHIYAVALTVPDYDQAIAYYCGVLGFALIEDTPQGGDKRWVMVRPKGMIGTNILLARALGETQIASIGNQTGGRVFVFLHTDNFDRDYQNYQANGVDFIGTPRNEPYGKVCKFRDAFDNLWDLLERSQTV
jgi:catechol 2,3-dioxygenase-like lactoylglutathione lyase family enzyme